MCQQWLGNGFAAAHFYLLLHFLPVTPDNPEMILYFSLEETTIH